MMSPYKVTVFVVVLCGLSAYCTADIEAFVKFSLTTTTCTKVSPVRDVCNVNWLIRDVDAEQYDSLIKGINDTITLKVLYRGLNEIEKIHCRRMYENMMCKSFFPVCDKDRMVIVYGNGTERCNFAREACPTVDIANCQSAPVFEESIIPEQNECINITAVTSSICPGAEVKAPEAYLLITDKTVKDLLKKAEMFSKEMKNNSITANCEANYREVLCRLVDSCSTDGFQYLQYINVSECERMISCVKNAGFSEEITSVCASIPSSEAAESVRAPNPYVRPKISILTQRNSPKLTSIMTQKTSEKPTSTGTGRTSSMETSSGTQRTSSMLSSSLTPSPTSSTEASAIVTTEGDVIETLEKPNTEVLLQQVVKYNNKDETLCNSASTNSPGLLISSMFLVVLFLYQKSTR